MRFHVKWPCFKAGFVKGYVRCGSSGSHFPFWGRGQDNLGLHEQVSGQEFGIRLDGAGGYTEQPESPGDKGGWRFKSRVQFGTGEGGKPWREERLGAGQGSQCRGERRAAPCLEVWNQTGAQEHALTDAVG